MLRRVEGEERRERNPLRAPDLAETAAVLPPIPDVDLDAALLPHDHPQWVKDAVTVSSRARELIARLKPAVVRILTFWDHRLRSTIVGGSRVCIDASGSYRLE